MIFKVYAILETCHFMDCENKDISIVIFRFKKVEDEYSLDWMP